MPWKNSPDFVSLIGAIVISLISGFISLSRRILKGHPVSALWVISELSAAILCGYLMFYSYPHLQDHLPEWVTLPVAISFGAYAGLRLLHETEEWVVKRYNVLVGMIESNHKEK